MSVGGDGAGRLGARPAHLQRLHGRAGAAAATATATTATATAAILRRWYVGHDAARGKDWSRAGDDQGDRQASPPRVSAPPFQRKPVPRITPTIDNPSCVPLGELDAVLNIITSTVAEHKAIAVDKAEEGCDTLSEAAAHAMDMFIVHEGCVTRRASSKSCRKSSHRLVLPARRAESAESGHACTLRLCHTNQSQSTRCIA